jgi:hypothetical protein
MSDATFTAIAELIALIVDPKGCAKRLADLQATLATVEGAQGQLESARIANERAFAEATADLDRRRLKIIEGEVELRLRRDAFDQREARQEASVSSYPTDPNFAPNTRHPNGLARGPE